MKKYIALFVCSICLMGWAFGQQFSASVSKKRVAVNEPFRLNFRIDNGQGQVKYPSFDGLQIVGGPNTSQSMQFVNGQMSQSVTYSFVARARKEGKLTIGAASVSIQGKTYRTEPIEMEVVAAAAGNTAGTNQAPANSGANQGNTPSPDANLQKQLADNVFLRAYVSKRNVFLGEQLTVTYKLFTRASIVDLRESSSPSFAGFWVENLDVGNIQFANEVLDGVTYRTAVVRKAVLIPQRAGQLKLDPYTLETKVRVTVSPSNRRGSIFDSFFSRYQDTPFDVSAPPVTIEVKPLPASGRPAAFANAVGKYDFEVSLDKTEVETGNPITLKVQISGEGNLKSIDPPAWELSNDFEVYDPKIDQRISTSGGRVRGQKSFDYLIIPQNPGTFTLPVMEFASFNPQTEQYQLKKSPEFTIQVSGEALAPRNGGGPVNRENVELLNEDINYIRTAQSGLRERGASFWGSALFWLLLILPFASFIALWQWKKKKEAEASDVLGTRMKKATKLARKRLTAVKSLIASSEDKAFYDELSRTLWGFLSDKLALSPSALDRDTVRNQLTQKGVTAERVDQLEKMLDDCEMALFAPVAVEGGKAGMYEQAVQLISDLEEEIK
jgi:hypothetical protein